MERHKLSTDVTYTYRNAEVSDVYHFGILHVSNLLLLLHHIDFLILLWHYIVLVDGYICLALQPFWNENGLNEKVNFTHHSLDSSSATEDGQLDNERVGGKNLTKLCEEELQWNVVAKEGLWRLPKLRRTIIFIDFFSPFVTVQNK